MAVVDSREEAAKTVSLHGVSVAQYAAVRAAVAEGFPLGDVLALEEIRQRVWFKADAAYLKRLAADAALLAAYREELAAAEDWLGRRVTPLEDDLGAWVGFLKAFSAHATPFVLLSAHGLSLGDLGRLRRRWAGRADADEEVREKLAELQGQPARPLPAITVAPAVLRRSRHVAGAGASGATETTATPAPAVPMSSLGVVSLLDVSFYRYVAAKARIANTPGDVEGAIRALGYAQADFAKADAAWQARLRDDAVLAGDYRRLLEHERGRLRATTKSTANVLAPAVDPPVAAAQPGPPGARTVRELASTSLALDLPGQPALPFVARWAQHGTAQRPAPVPRNAPGGGVPTGTALALNVPRDPVLPFAKGSAAPAAEAEGRKAPESLTGTSLALDVPRGPALPFGKDPGAAPAATSLLLEVPLDPAPPSPSGAVPPSEVRERPAPGTSLPPDVPRVPPPSPAKEAIVAPPASVASVAATPKRRKPPAELVETRFFTIPSNLPPPKKAAEVPPYVPSLTLEQHASLCVELAIGPERAAETLARYRLTPEERVRVDEHFRAKVAASPEARVAWDRAYRAYHAWFVESGRPRR